MYKETPNEKKRLNLMEACSLSDIEFNVVVIRMPKELRTTCNLI